MPKFKSPDGRVFDHILKAKHYFCHKDPCGTQFYCAECPIYIQSGEFPCEPWVNQHSAEAARMMGYDIIEGDQPESNQEAKADSGKPRPSLVQSALIRADMGVREYGCQKYHKPDNWRNVEASRYWDALLCHVLAAWDDWQAVDPESGLPHLHHIICNAGFLAQYMEEDGGE